MVRVLVIILIAVFNTESTPIFETFSEVSKSIKGYFQSTIDMVDNADSYIIDLVKTGNHAVDRSVLHTASFLKQLTFGTASELTFATYHSLCSNNIDRIHNLRRLPDTFRFKFVLMTPCKNYTYSVLDVENMWRNGAFDLTKKTVILITGWLLSMDDALVPIVHTISKAYLCRGDAIDPENHMNTLYEWAAYNTQEIGRSIGIALSLLKNRVSPNSIHIIGHSLGSHTASAAAKTYYSITGQLIGRITGLDPANPCFQVGGVLSEISRGDAQYIDIIHTNPGVLGKKEAIGDADFYPNGYYNVPNGCITNACAHNRAWEYYAESVYPGNEFNFISSQCRIQGRFRLSLCERYDVPMGYASDFRYGNGIFFLETNYKSPYGKNFTRKNYYPSCGLCKSKYRY